MGFSLTLHYSSISIHNKIEGDIRLFTKNGDVRVKKLRGHVIDIQAQGVGNTIYASDLLEAQSLNIDLPNPGRLRSKRIHANTCDIKIGIGGSSEQSDTAVNELIDADDSGSICDISSLYLTGEATICVQSPKNERPRQSVRVKSNHGHVTVDAISPKPELRNAMTGDALPIVDMGGVNGSCEVFVRGDKSNEEIEKDGWVSCHVHMDSISPDSVSIIKADVGNVHATFDRKVESDLRLLSASDAASVDVDTLLVDELEGDDFDDFKNMLRELDESSRPQDEKMIKIRTNAFTASNGSIDLGLENCELVEGWIENKTAEPDSRFDRKLRGDTGSIGKIRLEGAAFQALQGFQGAKTENDKDSFPRPLFAVFSTGEIVIETLSWLGNIARRYGLDDNRNKEDLGRTATRRGRSLDPTNE